MIRTSFVLERTCHGNSVEILPCSPSGASGCCTCLPGSGALRSAPRSHGPADSGPASRAAATIPATVSATVGICISARPHQPAVRRVPEPGKNLESPVAEVCTGIPTFSYDESTGRTVSADGPLSAGAQTATGCRVGHVQQQMRLFSPSKVNRAPRKNT